MYQVALYKAIRYFGSQEALAKAIGVTQQAISNWLNREHAIPYKQVLKIVAATQGYVTPQELAPQENQLNKFIDKLITHNPSKIIRVPIKSIQANYQLCWHEKDFCCTREICNELLHQPLLIDKNFQIIGCDCQLRLHQKIGHTFVSAKVIANEDNEISH